jgi:hypothetical protein
LAGSPVTLAPLGEKTMAGYALVTELGRRLRHGAAERRGAATAMLPPAPASQ